MDRSTRHTNTDLEIRVPMADLVLEVFYLNYEAPIPGWGFGNHAHSSYELHFVSAGRGTLRIGNQKFSVVPGTLYMTGPGVYHEQSADRRDPMNEYCLNFELLPGRAGRGALFLAGEGDEIAKVFAATPFWFGHDPSGSVSLFEDVFAELEGQGVGHYARIQSLIALIVLNAVRCFVGNRRSATTIPSRLVNDSRRLLVDLYFLELDRPRSRGELASILGTSVRHLNRVLVETYGMSFRQKLLQGRLALAADLLRHSRLPLAEVAIRVGFARTASFSKAFRASFGVAPSAFRGRGER